jgi:ribosome-associated protein YbcJ (S4-like RNA binding protein)
MKTSKTKYSKFNVQFIKLLDVFKEENREMFRRKFIENKSMLTDLDYFALKSMEDFSINGYENIFIETEELYDFLKEIKIVSHGDIASQIYMAIENRRYNEIVSTEGVLFRRYSFMLYAPINKINTSLAVTIFTTGKETFANNTNSINWISKIESGHKYITLAEKTFSSKTFLDWSQKETEEFHVIVNTLFYMNAFPDYIFEGVPKRAVIGSECFTKKRITLSPNKEFFEKLAVSPHLRRGHFRTFTSDYFKNMKGKTIWIEPVFVKGSALTVVDGISEGFCA